MAERLAVYYDPAILQHDTGEGFFEAPRSPLLPIAETHPENRARVENMLGILREGPLAADLDWFQAEPADREEIERFHTAEYVDELASIPETESRAFSGTTVFGPGSFDICCRAAGQAIGAANQVFNGEQTPSGRL